MSSTRDESRELRGQLVGELLVRSVIQSERVRDAFLAVPRELFVPEFARREGLAAVYRDEAILTKRNEHGVPLSSSSQPAIMALMLERLEFREGMRVLEVGAGTGYNAALIHFLVGPCGRVVSVDVDRQIAAQARRRLRDGGYRVRVAHADGRAGFARTAPYDRIIVTASADAVPHAWYEQLSDDGLLAVPLRLNMAGAQAIPVFRKSSRGFRSVSTIDGGFMPLRGENDDSAGELPREPCLMASDLTDLSRDRHEPLLQLSGAALATLSNAAKRRLIAIALEPPRRQRLGIAVAHGALSLYLSLTLPKSRRVRSFPSVGIGVIDRDGTSLALIERSPERPDADVVRAYGGHGAADFLMERVHEWVRRGRPSESDLRLTVAYEDAQSRIAYRWPPSPREAQYP